MRPFGWGLLVGIFIGLIYYALVASLVAPAPQPPVTRMPIMQGESLAMAMASHGEILLTPEERATRVTFYSVPRPFIDSEEDLTLISRQTRATKSWLALDPQPEILFMGNGTGVQEHAQSLGVRWIPGLQLNSRGTPLMQSMVELAEQHASNQVMVMINCDILLPQSWMKQLQLILPAVVPREQPFLVVGPRLEMDRITDAHLQTRRFRGSVTPHFQHVPGKVTSSHSAQDFFVYRKGTFQLPDFYLGRYAWDNWMVNHAYVNHWNIVSGWRAWNVGFYCMHSEHSRTHSTENSERYHNRDLAKATGGWDYGSLRTQKFLFARCNKNSWTTTRFCIVNNPHIRGMMD